MADVEEAPAQDAGAAETGEARLLQELFAGSDGLHSALDHSALEAAGGAARRDVERLAAAVAKQAASALAASRQARQQAGVHMCVLCAVHVLFPQSAGVMCRRPASKVCMKPWHVTVER